MRAATEATRGARALKLGATTNEAFAAAGYKLTPVQEHSAARLVVRNGRIVARTRNATHANSWLERLARKLGAA